MSKSKHPMCFDPLCDIHNQEWTEIAKALRVHADEVISPQGTNASLLRQNCRRAADLLDAHNAALAADQEKLKGELANGATLFRRTIELERQLADERKAFTEFRDSTGKEMTRLREGFEQQLAAEREKVK